MYNHKIMLKDGTRGHSVRYWNSLQKRVEELLGRPAIPGADYCRTEIVNYKTNKEYGVSEAINYCANQYLNKKIKVSGPKLILGTGVHVIAGIITRYLILRFCEKGCTNF